MARAGQSKALLFIFNYANSRVEISAINDLFQKTWETVDICAKANRYSRV
jgi:hypothetical protein